MDTSDIATLNDALGSAGVDLRVRLTLLIALGGATQNQNSTNVG